MIHIAAIYYHTGLKMVNVPWSESPRKKYVNPNEVTKGINLINTLRGDYNISSMLVITPVSR
jgi:hypothetical protein